MTELIQHLQIPWLECDILECERLGIPIIRRYSGGGAVYHDEGNALYSVITPREEFSRSKYTTIMAKAFTAKGIPIDTNARQDLIHQGCKVSGSAYRLIRDRAYHHGTMLLDTDLIMLKTLLKSPLEIEEATVSSVVSPVVNVTALSMEQFQSTMINIFRHESDNSLDVHEVDESTVMTKEIEVDMDELRSWDWTFGKGPSFRVRLADRFHLIERGCTINGDRFDTRLCKALQNLPKIIMG